MQKISDFLSAGFTGFAALVAVYKPELVASLDSMDILQQWGLMAGLASILYLVALQFNLDKCRSTARFWSGCVWGLLLLVGLFTQTFSVIAGAATFLFLFDFIATWKGRKCQKNNPTYSLTAS